MNYVGIDWAYGRAAWCARSETGTIAGEGMIPAHESGLARLVLKLGTEVEACPRVGFLRQAELGGGRQAAQVATGPRSASSS